MDLSIVIPCYNEIATIGKLREELLPVLTLLVQPNKSHLIDATLGDVHPTVEVIFVDDGSRDNTFFALLDAFGDAELPGLTFQFTQHRVNQGLGAALRTGFDLAKGAVIITTDCDGTYRFAEIPKLLARLTPEVDLVTASPYHPDGAVDGVPSYRLLLSRGSSAIYRMLADRRVYTYTALFRAYRREVIETVPFHATGFLAGTELLVNAIRMGYRVAEYPTVLHARRFGVSKAKIAQTVQAHLGFQMHTLLPWHPYGLIVRGDDATIYLIDQDDRHWACKRAFPSAETFLSHGYQWQQVAQLAQSELDAIPTGTPLTFRSATLLRGTEQTTYIMEEGRKRPFVTAAVFETLGYRWENVVTLDDAHLRRMPTGKPVTALDRHPDGTLLRGGDPTVYLLRGGRRCPIPSIQVFQSWGYQWEQVVEIDDAFLVRYPLGEPLRAQKSMFQQWRALRTHCAGVSQPTMVTAVSPVADQLAA
ncbi:MAG TPA: glycosyltransferase family 2 protein [Caldilineaceae bacterium]|nr:glycosyltransferase family 2 protein [Caldilineaceae bacterium]